MTQERTSSRKPSRKSLISIAVALLLLSVIGAGLLTFPWRVGHTVLLQAAPFVEKAARNAVTAYTLDFVYDEQLHTISGKERMEIQNTSGETWNELSMNDWASADAFSSAPNGGVSVFSECRLTLNGDQTTVVPVRDEENVCTVRIPLDKTLRNGESLLLEWDVLIHIPQGIDRIGYSDAACNLGSFIPQLALWREGEWATHPYCSYGESMASECADFSMTLKAPENLTVICTGESVTENGITTASAENVRDFCVVIGKGWHVAEKQHGDVLVRSYYKGSFLMGNEALCTALDALDAYGSTIGAYPYTTLDIVETETWAAGLEYPQLILMNSNGYEWSFDLVYGYVHDTFCKTVAHEVAHQWFYGVVGNDQYAEAWIDEGFASRLEHIYADYVDMYHATGYTDQMVPLDTSLDVLTKDMYQGVVYTCANAFLTDLSDMVGEEAFMSMLRDIYTAYGYAVVSTEDVLTVIRSYVPSAEKDNVESLIAEYFA